jgi:hypothetical protein
VCVHACNCVLKTQTSFISNTCYTSRAKQFDPDMMFIQCSENLQSYNRKKVRLCNGSLSMIARGLSVKPKTKISKMGQLKLIIEAWGLNPNEILTKEALSSPHKRLVDSQDNEIQFLNQTLKQAIVKELQQT